MTKKKLSQPVFTEIIFKKILLCRDIKFLYFLLLFYNKIHIFIRYQIK